MECSAVTQYISKAQEEETQENYVDASVHYLKVIGLLANHVCDERLSPVELAEIQYNLNTNIARTRFLLAAIAEQQNCKIAPVPSAAIFNSSKSLHVTTMSRSSSVISVFSERASVLMKPSFSGTQYIASDNNSLKKVKQTNECHEEKERENSLEDLVITETPNVKWESVIGLECAKQPIREAVLVPFLFPETVQAKEAWKGILLFGPSGVGKTQLVKAVATEATNVTFINVRINVIMSKWQGESEKNIAKVFSLARERSPAIIFIDEIDSICGERKAEDNDSARRIKNALLTEMDGMLSGGGGSQITIVGNTNLPGSLDGAFRRRFPKRIYVPLPNFEDRKEIVKQRLDVYNHTLQDKDIEDIACKTDRYSGADLVTLVTTAGMRPMQAVLQGRGVSASTFSKAAPLQTVRPVEMADMEFAISKTPRTNDDKTIRTLEAWNEKYGDGKCDYSTMPKKKTGLGAKILRGLSYLLM